MEFLGRTHGFLDHKIPTSAIGQKVEGPAGNTRMQLVCGSISPILSEWVGSIR